MNNVHLTVNHLYLNPTAQLPCNETVRIIEYKTSGRLRHTRRPLKDGLTVKYDTSMAGI